MPHPRWIVVAMPNISFVRCAVPPNQTYSNFHPLSADEFHASHSVLLHLYELGKFLRQVGAESAGGGFTERMTCTTCKEQGRLAAMLSPVAPDSDERIDEALGSLNNKG